MKATRQDAYDLFHKGTLALAEMEQTGIRIDIEYLDRTIDETEKKISEAEVRLKDSKVWRHWKRRFGNKSNLDSDKQLVPILIEHCGYKPGEDEITAKGNIKADEHSLRKIKHPFVKDYFEVKKLKKTNGTYLKGIRREVCGDRLHCSFNLAGGVTEDTKGGAASYRGSGSNPNLQNLPIRNKVMGSLIRPAFIPSENSYLAEVDYKVLEVRSACFYNKDRNLIRYVTDDSTDMHADLAKQLFMVSPKDYKEHKDYYKKTIRDCTKNKWTFPQFYGSVWFQCAPDMWEMMNKREFKYGGEKGQDFKDYLRGQGITKLGQCEAGVDPIEGTFGYHTKQVERDMRKNRFPEYTQRKRDFYEEYLEKGYFDLLTGFRCEGYFRRNQVINFPGQGVAFHCLLYDIIEINEELRKRRMKARLVCQIHDSLMGDVPKKEMQEFLDICYYIMSKKIRKHWEWINVPMVTEVDASDRNWFEKSSWINNGERWAAA